MRYPLHSIGFAALTALAAISLAPVTAHAQEDLGFRYQDGKCVNEAGEEGRNPGYKGECGNLQGEDLQGLPLDGIDFSGANLRGARSEEHTSELQSH